MPSGGCVRPDYPVPVTSSWLTPVLTGVFGLCGVLGGVSLTSAANHRLERRKRSAEDDRRWLTDRRQLYARYMTMCESMLREIDSIAVFLSYDGTKSISSDDEHHIGETLLAYNMKWDDELQPLLEELQLIALPKVSDLAVRMSGALMELTTTVESRGRFIDHYPIWFQARDLLGVLRNAMRGELGIALLPDGPRNSEWPWLADRPARRAYIQYHDTSEECDQPEPR